MSHTLAACDDLSDSVGITSGKRHARVNILLTISSVEYLLGVRVQASYRLLTGLYGLVNACLGVIQELLLSPTRHYKTIASQYVMSPTCFSPS